MTARPKATFLSSVALGAVLLFAASGCAIVSPDSSHHLSEDLAALEPSDAPTTDFATVNKAGVEFVRAWGQSGFPTSDDDPSWYCPLWLLGSSGHRDYDWLKTEDYRPGSSWTIDEDSNIRDVRITFESESNGEDMGLPFSVQLLRDMEEGKRFCVSVVREAGPTSDSIETNNAFVAAWAEAGFPAETVQPGWFCINWGAEGREIREWMHTSTTRNSWTWHIIDDVTTSDVAIDFQGTGGGEYAMYVVKIGDDEEAACIESITARRT